MTAIWWIRRDLRLNDNPALAAAGKQGGAVPLFILDPALSPDRHDWTGRYNFMLANLHQLRQQPRALGARLVVRAGPPNQVLPAVVRQLQADVIYAEADPSRYARSRDRALQRELPLQLVGSPAIRTPGSVLKADGDPYVVYSAYRRRWQAEMPAELPRHPVPTPASFAQIKVESERLAQANDYPGQTAFPAGEAAAQARLQAFVDSQPGLTGYAANRDLLDTTGTSRLSPYLRFGVLSAAAVLARVREWAAQTRSKPARQSAEKFQDELVWREFYFHVLHHFPHVQAGNFRRRYDALEWENNRADFDAWRKGETGYPVVDAGMRQLLRTGWMHNRARMITASFLVKHLLVDWRWGERFFMQHLLDGDPAANNGGWQWVAGTGTDAAPYFRIFNPVRQSKRFDPEGRYIRRWLPAMERVPDAYIHQPWTMPESIQTHAGVRIGREYPAAIIDHSYAMARALERFQRISVQAAKPQQASE